MPYHHDHELESVNDDYKTFCTRGNKSWEFVFILNIINETSGRDRIQTKLHADKFNSLFVFRTRLIDSK